jgi:bifunctional oligoribonuclease and PAP phosphatase NrnA
MKVPAKTFQRILEAIEGSRSLCVVGHVRPDGDCIGSQLAVTLALRELGKEVVCWNEDTVPAKYAFLDTRSLVRPPRRGVKFDCVVAVDAASYERLGKVGDCIRQRGVLINIDHHESNTRYGDINWVSSRDPSTGELVYRLLKNAGWKITREIADCLFTAISTDTGSFQYPSTRPDTYHVAADLVKRGADLGRICNQVYQSYPLSRVRLLRHVYNNFHLTCDNRVAWFWLRRSDFVRTGAQPSDSEGLIDHVRDIEPVIVACVFEEMEPGVVRISLRSKDPAVSVNEIAGQFGGGGHPAAAGARIPGNELSIQRRVLRAIREALDRPSE